MKASQIVIVGMTFYGNLDGPAYQLGIRTIEAAHALGYDIVIVDNSPEAEPAAHFSSITGVRVFPQLLEKAGPSCRHMFFLALEIARQKRAEAILWIEPVHLDIIRFIPKLIEPLRHGAAIVMPQRTKASWETHSRFRTKDEQEANQALAKITGRDDIDYFFRYGLYRLDVVLDIINMDPRKWHVPDTDLAQHILLSTLFQEDLPVVSVPVDLIYPPELKEKEEKELDKDKVRQKRLIATVDACYTVASAT